MYNFAFCLDTEKVIKDSNYYLDRDSMLLLHIVIIIYSFSLVKDSSLLSDEKVQVGIVRNCCDLK